MTVRPLSATSWAELCCLAVIWGGIFLAVRVALEELPVLTTVAHRVFWAALLLWGVAIALRLPIPMQPRLWLMFGGMGLLNNIIPFALMAWGQLHIETGLTSILNATTAFFGVMVAALFLREERLRPARVVGVLIGIGGVVVVMGPGSLQTLDITSLAQLAVLAATLSYAFAGVWGRIYLSEVPPLIAAAGMLTTSAIIAVPAAWIVDGPFNLALSAASWGAIIYYAAIGTAGAYILYYRILSRSGPANLMLVTLLIPPVAISLGAIIRHEALAVSDFLGFGMIALGLMVLDGRFLSHMRSLLRLPFNRRSR